MLTSIRRTTRRALVLASAIGVTGALLATPVQAASGTVLIWGPSVSGGAASFEAQRASAQGFTVEVVDSAGWAAKSAAQFSNYSALIVGDPTCGPVAGNGFFAAINANKAVWSSVVDGNVIINGTDPIYHRSQGGAQVVDRGIAFAGDAAGKTGLYASLSCAYHATPLVNVDFLSEFGTFSVQGVGCFNDAHIVATHPALQGLTDANLSNWTCSVHEAFRAQPADFTVLAIARNASPSTYTAPDGSVGLPYILARGEGLAAGDISLTPASQSHGLGETATLTALVSSGGTPQSGVPVDFTVLSGPNAGGSGSGVTGPAGTATFSYVGTLAGTDTVQASFVRGSITQTSNVAAVEWVGATNTPPSVTIDTAAPAGVEGSPIAIQATATDSDNDALTYSWTSGSLGGLDAGAACSFSPPDAEDAAITCTDDTDGGLVPAVLTVSDGVNPPVVTSVDVSIANAAPVVSGLAVTGGTQVACLGGNSVGASFTASDAGTNDTHTGVIDWGDSTSTAGFAGTHSYAAGSHTISVAATDDDGATSGAVAGTSTAPVSLLYASTGIEQPINTDGSSNFKLGRVIPVKTSFTDCAGLPVSVLAPQVSLTKTGSGSGEVNEVVSASAADAGRTMRHAGEGRYIFNLSTKLSQFNAGQDLTPGRYRLRISAPGISTVEVSFDIRA